MNVTTESTAATTNKTVVSTWDWTLTIQAVSLLVIAVWIIFANSMIVAAPLVYKPLRKKTYVFVSSLGVADLLTAVVVPAAWFMSSLDNMAWDFYNTIKSNFYCQWIMFCNVFPLLSSIFNLFLIALDRFIGIVYPMKYDLILTRWRIKFLLVLVWMVSILLAAVNFVWNRNYSSGILKCFILDMAPTYFHFLGCLYWTLTIIMFVLYTKIGLTLNSGKRTSLRSSTSAKTKKVRKTTRSDRRAVAMLFIALTVFVCCWTPLVLALHVFVSKRRPILVVNACLILAYLNSGMNFIIYVVRHKKYKNAFRLMCPLCVKDRDALEAHESKDSSDIRSLSSQRMHLMSTSSSVDQHPIHVAH